MNQLQKKNDGEHEELTTGDGNVGANFMSHQLAGTTENYSLLGIIEITKRLGVREEVRMEAREAEDAGAIRAIGFTS